MATLRGMANIGLARNIITNVSIVFLHMDSPFPSFLLSPLYYITTCIFILWYDNFGENHTTLQRNGMAAIPKIYS